jgi:hypothetical protein
VRCVLAGALALSLLGCEAAGEGNRASTPAPPATLHVITGLPLFFDEGFSLESDESPILTRLEQDFTVVPVDGPEQLPSGGLLLAAQPRAMTARRLVALDRWVREGGRLLLLADPWLTWPSELPLGTPGRPPVEFADTGLLSRWGLILEGSRTPPTEQVERTVGGRSLFVSAPGVLTSRGPCRVESAGFVARCRIGRGRVLVVADADFLRAPQASGQDAVVRELQALSTR